MNRDVGSLCHHTTPVKINAYAASELTQIFQLILSPHSLPILA